MKKFLWLLLLVSIGNEVAAQSPLDIREKIIPLRSTRDDVLKIARIIEEKDSEATFENDQEQIFVSFVEKPCADHGWNVPAGRVLSYRVVPKKELPAKAILTDEGRYAELRDDTFRRFINDSARGMTVVIKPPFEHIESVSFSATEADSDLRCAGFPPFSFVGSSYAPNFFMPVRDVRKWDVGLLFVSFFQMKDAPDHDGYVLIYCRRGRAADCAEIRKKVISFSRSTPELIAAKATVIVGGFRDRGWVETFLVRKGLPPPMPTPKYPSQFIMNSNGNK